MKPKNVIKSSNKNVSDVFNKGRDSFEFEDIYQVSIEKFKIEQRELLKKFVNDEELLDIVLQDENMKKFKHRFISEVNIYDEYNVIIGNMKSFERLPLEYFLELKNKIEKGSYISSKDLKLRFSDSKVFESKGGNVLRIKLKVSFVKG